MAALMRIWGDFPDDCPGDASVLRKLLDPLTPQARPLVWSILELEARSSALLAGGVGILELERAANESPSGLLISWDHLCEYAQGFVEIINGTFIGYTPDTTIPVFHRDMDIYAPSALVIEAFDTTYWLVYARDEQILQPVRAAFRDIEALALPVS